MLCIIDKRSDQQSIQSLRKLVDSVIEFQTEGLVYDAISGHPDIFFTDLDPHTLIVAPNTPQHYIDLLTTSGIKLICGKHEVGNTYPSTARYNALFTPNFLICNSKIIDPILLDNIGTRSLINVPQGYVRCNTISLNPNTFITSDLSIHRQLTAHQASTLYINPKGVSINGFPHGFIGGTMGLIDDNLIINGSLTTFPEGNLIRQFATLNNIQITQLSTTNLYDGGGIIFKKKKLQTLNAILD